MSISNANPSVATFNRYRYVATGGETSVSGADANGNVLSYSPGREQVYLNGAMLVRAQDYTATTGSSITGITALVANDVLEVLAFTSFAVAAGVAQDEAPSSPAEGQLWLDTNGTVPGVQLTRWSLEPAAGTTSLTGADNFSVTLSYTAGLETVYRNGVLLSRGNDYTATNGTSITLTDATLAGDIIEVFGPSSIGFADAIANSLVDAKGDLITASSNNVPARIAVGSNDQVLVADSSASNGLAWKSVATPYAAGKNLLLNADYNINQRAFSSTTSSGAYGFDRWQYVYSGGTVTYSAQTFTPGTAPVAGYEGKNFARVLTASQSATNHFAIFRQQLESVRTLAGQTATLSFWAKAASGTPKVALEIAQNFGTGGSPSAEVTTYSGQVTLSTSWTRYSITFAVPSISGKTLGTAGDDKFIVHLFTSAGSDFNARTGSIGIQNNTFDFWGVQLESGSTATPFQTATGTLQGELAACQRYYYRTTGGAEYDKYGWTMAYTTTGTIGMIHLPVTMRVAPTALDYSNINIYLWGTSGYTISSVALNGESTQNLAVVETAGSTGLTQNRMYQISAAPGTSYLGFTAEL